MSKFIIGDEVRIHTNYLSNDSKEKYNNQIGTITHDYGDSSNYRYLIKMDNDSLNNSNCYNNNGNSSGWVWSDDELEIVSRANDNELKVNDRVMVMLESKNVVGRDKYVGHTGAIKQMNNSFGYPKNKMYIIIFDDEKLEKDNEKDGYWYWEFHEILKLRDVNFVR